MEGIYDTKLQEIKPSIILPNYANSLNESFDNANFLDNYTKRRYKEIKEKK